MNQKQSLTLHLSPQKLLTLSTYIQPTARNLGIIFDSASNLILKELVPSCFFQLRTLSEIKPMLSHANLEKK